MKSPPNTKSNGHASAANGQLSLVYGSLAVIVAARLLLMSWPAMWLWGLNTQRFLGAPLALLCWSVMALPFVGPVGVRLTEALESLGNRLADSSRARLTAAALFAIAVFLLDDRTLFTGDFLIRRVASDSPEFLARFRQSLPLELLLFERLPLAIQGYLLPPGMLPRVIGAAAAFVLGMASLELGRDWARRGVTLVAVASVVAFGGYLAVFTGLGKPAALLCALTALTALLSVRVATTGKGLAPLGCTVFVALVLHRAGALLLPCWLLALYLSLRRPSGAARAPRGATWAFALLPLGAMAVVGRQMLRIVAEIDVPQHVIGAAGASWRLLDLANLSWLMVPVAFPLLLGAWDRPSAWLKTREAALLLMLLAPCLVVAAVATPAQGVFRDLDFHAPAAVALAALCGWILSRMAAGENPSHRIAAAVTSTCIASTLQLLFCFHQPASGLERVRAYLSEAPQRPASERETTWDFLSLRAFALRDWPLAVVACGQAAQLAPSPRVLMMLGIARTYTGDYTGAQQAYSRVIERSPHELVAWAGLAGLAARLGDPQLADSALAHVRLYPETSVKARELRQVIEQYPEFWPGARR